MPFFSPKCFHNVDLVKENVGQLIIGLNLIYLISIFIWRMGDSSEFDLTLKQVNMNPDLLHIVDIFSRTENVEELFLLNTAG